MLPVSDCVGHLHMAALESITQAFYSQSPYIWLFCTSLKTYCIRDLHMCL